VLEPHQPLTEPEQCGHVERFSLPDDNESLPVEGVDHSATTRTYQPAYRGASLS